MNSCQEHSHDVNVLRATVRPLVRLARTLGDARTYCLERALRSLFQPVEGGALILKLPDFQGSFEIDSRSDVLAPIPIHGAYEPEVVRLISQRLNTARDVRRSEPYLERRDSRCAGIAAFLTEKSGVSI